MMMTYFIMMAMDDLEIQNPKSNSNRKIAELFIYVFVSSSNATRELCHLMSCCLVSSAVSHKRQSTSVEEESIDRHCIALLTYLCLRAI